MTGFVLPGHVAFQLAHSTFLSVNFASYKAHLTRRKLQFARRLLRSSHRLRWTAVSTNSSFDDKQQIARDRSNGSWSCSPAKSCNMPHLISVLCEENTPC